MSPHEAMLAIQELMDGVEWDADTLDGIAQTLNEAGYTVRGPGENPVKKYERDTWFFMRVKGLDDDDGIDRHTPVGSLVFIDQTFESEDNYSILCPANGAGFFMNAEEISTELMPVPTVYDSLEAEDENSVMDRYTVFPAGEIEEVRSRYSYLGCSIGGRAVSMWGEIKHTDIAAANFDALGRKVPVYHLDQETQRHIFNRLKD